jgi:hypothetical protein
MGHFLVPSVVFMNILIYKWSNERGTESFVESVYGIRQGVRP